MQGKLSFNFVRAVARERVSPFNKFGNGVEVGRPENGNKRLKRIVINSGAALSLQMPHHQAEQLVFVRGTARVTRRDEAFLVSGNESTYIPIGTRHRLEKPDKCHGK